jgi:predicted nucleic acid-binding protein
MAVARSGIKCRSCVARPGFPSHRALPHAAEIGNAVWKAVRSGKGQRSEALAGIDAVLLWFELLIPIEHLHVRALDLAIALRHPIYDCFYLALAERENAPVATADESMIAAARKLKIKVQRI